MSRTPTPFGAVAVVRAFNTPTATYFVTFTAEPEDQSMSDHFRKTCGWSAAEVARIRHYDWFCARVDLQKNGAVIATEYLGACCYKHAHEFFTTYQADYFADMVCECAAESKDADLIAQTASWRASLRAAERAATPIAA